MSTDQTGDLALIRTLETLAANAWPAAEIAELSGWRLRHTTGVTRRANSVWPNQWTDDAHVAERLGQVEAFYQQRRLPARYQICPAALPIELDEQLAARGYASVARTAVQTTPLTKILEETKALRWYPTFAVEISEEFDEDWFAVYSQVEHGDAISLAVRGEILRRIQAPVGFALLKIAETPAAVGLGVIEAGWLGIFCMATLPAFRRQGAANAILRTLAIWAAQLYDARQAYLQVMEANSIAQAVYSRVGFSTLYHYHYREKAVSSEE
jgi:ribosomal protein S18 acetylase RimI-like enzyme